MLKKAADVQDAAETLKQRKLVKRYKNNRSKI